MSALLSFNSHHHMTKRVRRYDWPLTPFAVLASVALVEELSSLAFVAVICATDRRLDATYRRKNNDCIYDVREFDIADLRGVSCSAAGRRALFTADSRHRCQSGGPTAVAVASAMQSCRWVAVRSAAPRAVVVVGANWQLDGSFLRAKIQRLLVVAWCHASVLAVTR